MIHACYNTSLAHGSPVGALRVIDTSKPNGVCASWEAPLSWNQRGEVQPISGSGTIAGFDLLFGWHMTN